MADLARNGAVERDIEQAITALKKGAQLLKYGRRGKPKFCPFRLSNDETALIWYSGKEEKHLRLSSITRIIPGQRTATFQRYPRLEKEYQSFSLIYGNDRSLDLICKDKDEAEVWFVGLKALVSGGQLARLKFDTRNDGGGVSSDANSPAAWSRISPASSPYGSSSDNQRQDTFKFSSPYGSPPRYALQRNFPPSSAASLDSKVFLESGSLHSLHSASSDIGSEPTSVQARGSGPGDAFRVSMSSAVSSSSQGSGQEEGDALGDVFLWGEGMGDGILGGGVHNVGNDNGGVKMDALLPKALESAVVLDVHNIACGSHHAALVTKQGEVFCWGEESGGRLGHGVDVEVPHPRLLDALATTNTEFVACGEYHTCAVTLSGDLYTWGDGTHSVGLLGHGNDISHWTPKRVGGPLEGIRISSVACGIWHTALVTSAGQLFTFGDGTFGVLGHGDRKSVSLPKEVESLKGLKTVRVACGVWHTAAVVEVMVGYSSTSSCSSGKLFTWGDGDKGRLGHGDKEQKLVPTCVAALVDYNFRQVACGHTLTVALTTSGRVFTMGNTIFGQLGDPRADGKLPGIVEGKLWEAFVEEIACGAYHVAVLTAKTEVYTWGKGANGRLGHGDVADRNAPTLVEALKDKQVKSIACGSGFTAAICLHKWVSGADQSLCSGCRQPFGFTRKRHNCYNCGLAFCHGCSSRKAMKASLAPNPNKPYRVCDPCFLKLKKGIEGGGLAPVALPRKSAIGRRSSEVGRVDRLDFRAPKPPPGLEQQRQIEAARGAAKRSKKLEIQSADQVIASLGPMQAWGAVDVPSVFNPSLPNSKAITVSVPASRIPSRSVSPLSRRPSPPRSATPTPTLTGLTSPKIMIEDLKKSNEILNLEVVRLREQVDELVRKLQSQESELRRSSQQVQEAIVIAGEESAKCQAAKEVIKQLTAQLKEMAERVPAGGHRASKGSLIPLYHHHDTINGVHHPSSAPTPPPVAALDTLSVTDDEGGGGGYSNHVKYSSSLRNSDVINGESGLKRRQGVRNYESENESVWRGDDDHHHHHHRLRSAAIESSVEPDSDWVEQDQPGVYLTLCSLSSGGRELKRVRFSRKRFSEKEAEQWWQENRQRVHDHYNIRSVDRTVASNKM